MRIGVIGSGIVGQTLSRGFMKHGHSVMIGTRDRSKLEEWSKTKGMGIAVGDFNQVAEFGDILLLAVKGTVAKAVLSSIDQASLQGKCIMDATNPIDPDRPPVNGVLHFTTALDSSLMEELQKSVPDAHFVKVFNSVGSGLMVNPATPERPSMFICGNHDESKKKVESILTDFGWETVDMGKVEAARAIEPLCMLWCIPGFLRNEWSHAFKLVQAT